MTDIKNPRAVEALQVLQAVSCMKLLNENDLKSLNLEWVKEIVADLQVECEKFREQYRE